LKTNNTLKLNGISYIVARLGEQDISIMVIENKKLTYKCSIDINNICEKGIERIIKEISKMKYKGLKMAKENHMFRYISIPNFKKIIKTCMRYTIIYLFKKPTIVTDRDRQLSIVQQYHDDPILGGHSGIAKHG
jgi:hypothetical protein